VSPDPLAATAAAETLTFLCISSFPSRATTAFSADDRREGGKRGEGGPNTRADQYAQLATLRRRIDGELVALNPSSN